ncbi:MAG: nucleotidyltransferase family protein [Candidatus Pacebacteria bacterium]|nr:nucleotidyltransferase family protein [Candidatus Paceibacterota bacterium]
MQATDVINLYTKLEEININIWIDGGWAVDALVGKQTREHQDLDIAVEDKDLSQLKEYLKSQGYKEAPRAEDPMWDLVLKDDAGLEVEVHAFTLDENQEVVEQPYWDGYSKDSLSGVGNIAGQEVRCVSLNQLVKTHNKEKRALKEKDYNDMRTLTEHFGVGFTE